MLGRHQSGRAIGLRLLPSAQAARSSNPLGRSARRPTEQSRRCRPGVAGRTFTARPVAFSTWTSRDTRHAGAGRSAIAQLAVLVAALAVCRHESVEGRRASCASGQAAVPTVARTTMSSPECRWCPFGFVATTTDGKRSVTPGPMTTMPPVDITAAIPATTYSIAISSRRPMSSISRCPTRWPPALCTTHTRTRPSRSSGATRSPAVGPDRPHRATRAGLGSRGPGLDRSAEGFALPTIRRTCWRCKAAPIRTRATRNRPSGCRPTRRFTVSTRCSSSRCCAAMGCRSMRLQCPPCGKRPRAAQNDDGRSGPSDVRRSTPRRRARGLSDTKANGVQSRSQRLTLGRRPAVPVASRQDRLEGLHHLLVGFHWPTSAARASLTSTSSPPTTGPGSCGADHALVQNRGEIYCATRTGSARPTRGRASSNAHNAIGQWPTGTD